MQGSTYQPSDLNALFNQTPNQIMDTLEKAGEGSGVVGRSLLPRSSHLRNKRTGLVLPWSMGLAEQTDIMECCDATGNTDPAAWEPTVNPEEYTDGERDALYLSARQSAISHVQQMNAAFQQPKDGTTPIPKGPGYAFKDAISLDEYYTRINSNMDAINSQLKDL